MLATYIRLISATKDEEGQTMAEYAIILALIAAVVIGVVTLVGTDIKAVFQGIVTALPGGGA